MNRKNLLIGSALVLAALLVVGGTMAWFTAGAGPVTNTFTAGTVEIELHDVTYDDLQALVPFPENGIQNVNPGDDYTKIVYVKNTGSKAVYVRVYLTPAWTDPEGASLPLEAGDPSVPMATFPLLTGSKWVLHTDGYYYYKDPVAPGASTQNLIEQVIFAGAEMTNDYQGATFTLKVEAEAVQASHEAYKDEWGTDITFLTPYIP